MKSIKRFLAVMASVFVMSSAMAQKGKDKEEKSAAPTANLTYVSANAKLAKIYTQEELEKMGKLELTQLYMERIAVVTELAPYVALHTKPGATLKEMGIPETPQNLEHLQKEVKNKDAYLSTVKDTLDDIIPYADKKNIIWAIVFFQEVVQKIQSAED